jgi:tRNA-dihydrouridine synthase C
MEGVTDPVFRDLVLDLGGVGAASTEFVRVSSHALPVRVFRRHLGTLRADCPVAVQIMAADPEHLAPSVRNAERAGAAWIDLNFGCPAKVVFNKCAGSAMLDRPAAMAAVIRTAVSATSLPVTAKIRAGIDAPDRLAEVVEACADAGAAAIALHARLKVETYSQPPTWAWIRQAKEHLTARGHRTPLIGNGGVASPENAERMRRETGCDAVMVGRGAIADPFIFRRAAGQPPATRSEAASFALRYAQAVEDAHHTKAALARLKQLLRWYTAGGLIPAEDTRRQLLRERSLEALRGWLKDRAVST